MAERHQRQRHVKRRLLGHDLGEGRDAQHRPVPRLHRARGRAAPLGERAGEEPRQDALVDVPRQGLGGLRGQARERLPGQQPDLQVLVRELPVDEVVDEAPPVGAVSLAQGLGCVWGLGPL